MSQHALVVEDDPVAKLVLSHMLRARGWEIEEAADTLDAIALVEEREFDLVVSDFRLPSGTGIEILDALDASGRRVPFMLITGIIERSPLMSGVMPRLAAQLTKPVSSAALADALDRLFPRTSG